MRKALTIAASAALLAGCGAKADLKWPDNKTPPQPATSSEPQTFQKMMTPPAQAAPNRVNDPLNRSQPRPDDRFDLPPPG